ncbi:hypothetical protein F2Z80_17970 [Vibrio fortis]|uniref:Uncharacterized protein n=1 Tax=Vibrio fortis TaxID=212667 RepID=A0A5N3S3S2_9VIBR|nr:SIR2 family protein [Vibrio fortis]KAB0300972.1 hypothetical protein F2Z80_17970 [Vibrio fortis]
MTIKDNLVNVFQTRNAGPFLFVGSGFSRRYLGLEDWKGLLQRYCVSGKPFEYYLASGDGTYPTAARLIAEDFNQIWWNSDDYAESRAKYSERVTDSTSALRIEVSQYLSNIDEEKVQGNPYEDEIRLLSNLNVDGIITTNWDCFLEQIFPDYRVYTGQNELLFSNPQSVGEIYKIHGSSHRPKSLVLTDQDYHDFNEKNAYLAAKLITIFVEHPVVFIGYSLSDENISDLLSAISLCIGKENINQLRQNLIFVQRLNEGDVEGISDTYLTINSVQIPIVLVKTNDFSSIYEAIDATKRKIPARILRYCKEQLYNLVQSNAPEKKICVVGIDEVEKHEDVEFVVGIGVAAAQEEQISQIGYKVLSIIDLFHDLLFDDRELDAKAVINEVISTVGRYSANVPVFKYLRSMGITSLEEYKASGLALDKWVIRDMADLQVKAHARPFVKHHKNKSSEEIIATCTPENAAIYIPFLKRDAINLEAVNQFLKDNETKFEQCNSTYSSYYRKLASLYDRYKYGW